MSFVDKHHAMKLASGKLNFCKVAKMFISFFNVKLHIHLLLNFDVSQKYFVYLSVGIILMTKPSPS
jgi:hypothetical protein